MSASVWTCAVQRAVSCATTGLASSVLRTQFSSSLFLPSLVSSFQAGSISGLLWEYILGPFRRQVRAIHVQFPAVHCYTVIQRYADISTAWVVLTEETCQVCVLNIIKRLSSTVIGACGAEFKYITWGRGGVQCSHCANLSVFSCRRVIGRKDCKSICKIKIHGQDLKAMAPAHLYSLSPCVTIKAQACRSISRLSKDSFHASRVIRSYLTSFSKMRSTLWLWK